MSHAQASPPPEAFPDRTTRLMVLGGLQIVLGLVAALMVALMAVLIVLGPLVPPPQGQPMDTKAMVPAMVIYVPIAVGLIWLGIGMIRTRRWAWTLTVVLSWMWLIIGVFSFVMVQFFMGPKTWAAIAEQGKLAPDAVAIARITMSLTLACIYLLLPGFFLILCHNQAVRATCYRRDPKPRWTDRCPMPVLALSILMGFSAVSMLSLAAYNWLLPLFGFFLSGPTGALAIVFIALMLACLAWGIYRLRLLAWWGMLLFGLASSLNSVVTFWRTDLIQLYQKMGMPADQIELLRNMGLSETISRCGPWMALAGGVAWVCYLLYLRRYFVRGSARRPSLRESSVG